jgi:hypothetical protein
MSKVKGYLILFAVLFFIAYNPSGAATLAGTIGRFFVHLMNGLGTMASSAGGGH